MLRRVINPRGWPSLFDYAHSEGSRAGADPHGDHATPSVLMALRCPGVRSVASLHVKVLVLTPNIIGTTPGQRSSVELWDKVLRKHGFDLTFSPFETPGLHRVLQLPGHVLAKTVETALASYRRCFSIRDLESFDAVLVYREAALIGPALIERLVARRNVPLIYQLDDPLHIPYRSPSNGYFSYLKCFGKVHTLCRISDLVIVNSKPLEILARSHNRNVWRVPSLVDGKLYAPQPGAQATRNVTIGWSGSPSSSSNLAVIAEPLRRLEALTRHSLRIIGTETPPLPGLSYTARPWSAETEVVDLRKLQVGLVPVPDRPWNHWKFFMKVAQYMALGIPPVCSPIGSNPDVVEHGVTGFLATTPDEWLTSLQMLINDSELRAEMSQRAAEVAAKHYTLQAQTPRILAAFESLAT